MYYKSSSHPVQIVSLKLKSILSYYIERNRKFF